MEVGYRSIQVDVGLSIDIYRLYRLEVEYRSIQVDVGYILCHNPGGISHTALCLGRSGDS